MTDSLCILSISTSDWNEVSKITTENMVEYARRYNYTVLGATARTPYDGYEKLEKIKSLFEIGIEIVWSKDGDTLITNFNTDIQSFVDDEHDFFICKDVNSINAGSFIIKKSEWSLKFIDFLLAQRGKEKMYCEQNAIEAYQKEFPDDNKIKITPHPAFNSYLYENYPEFGKQTEENGQWIEGKSFVLHLPGLDFKKRIEILKSTPIIK